MRLISVVGLVILGISIFPFGLVEIGYFLRAYVEKRRKTPISDLKTYQDVIDEEQEEALVI